MSQN